jgi:hypothetical protein
MNRLSASKKLLRLVSARYDMAHAMEAYGHYKATLGTPAAEHFFFAMVVAYGRPFFESHGLGQIRCEYPNYPDFAEPNMNLRHHRLLDVRNKFLAHSNAEGTRVIIIPPKIVNPLTGIAQSYFDHNVGKRTFLDPRYVDWLKDVVYAFKGLLDVDVRKQLEAEFGTAVFTQPFEIETGWEDFKWT